MTPRGQSLPTHQKVLLFIFSFVFWQSETETQASIKEWLESAKTMQVRENRASLCGLEIRTQNQGELFEQDNRKEADSRECPCCVVSPRVAFHCVSL